MATISGHDNISKGKCRSLRKLSLRTALQRQFVFKQMYFVIQLT